MKPPPFRFFSPSTLPEALALLREHGEDAKLLAGGQSLIPAMNFRLARPSVLIDINRVAELSFLTESADLELRIGAAVRQARLERDPLTARRAPLLCEALTYVAHPQIRNRGTIGGSLAHADPAAELPAVTLLLRGRLRAASSAGQRWIDARDFYLGLFTTALAPDEILAEIALPPLPPRSGCAVLEIARRRGDYAVVGAAARVQLDERGLCQSAGLVLFGVADRPVEIPAVEGVMRGQRPDAQALRAASVEASRAGELDPPSDAHATPAYRRHLAQILTQRVLAQAATRAAQGIPLS